MRDHALEAFSADVFWQSMDTCLRSPDRSTCYRADGAVQWHELHREHVEELRASHIIGYTECVHCGAPFAIAGDNRPRTVIEGLPIKMGGMRA